ncbi:hypothetical protein ABBQ32_013948 [Trebouxia sp. C0010 RCD-2024]
MLDTALCTPWRKKLDLNVRLTVASWSRPKKIFFASQAAIENRGNQQDLFHHWMWSREREEEEEQVQQQQQPEFNKMDDFHAYPLV